MIIGVDGVTRTKNQWISHCSPRRGSCPISNRHIRGCCPNDGTRTYREAKSTVKDLVSKELSTMIEYSLDDLLWNHLRIVQTCFRSVLRIIAEHVMLDLVHKDVIGESLDAPIVKFIDPYPAAERLSKRLLISGTFMVPFATLVKRKSDSAIAQKCSKSFTIKDSIDTLVRYQDIDDLPLSLANAEAD